MLAGLEAGRLESIKAWKLCGWEVEKFGNTARYDADWLLSIPASWPSSQF